MLTADAMLLEAKMGVLDKLKIVALAPKAEGNVEQERRQKLVQQLNEQLKMVEAALGGAGYERTKQTKTKDAEGNAVQVVRAVRLRQWWSVGANGSVQFALRYGAVPLEVKKGMSAVEVAKLADLPAMLKLLLQAVEAGELDAAIGAVMATRKGKAKASA